MSGLRFILGLLLATPFVVFGAIMYVKIGNDERQYQAEMRQIAARQVQAERLTLVRTYTSGSQSPIFHLVYRSTTRPDFVLMVPDNLYGPIKPGDLISGYEFPDGYLVPSFVTNAMRKGHKKQYAAKTKSIQTGQVQPQTLAVVRKDDSGGTNLIICRSTNGDDINQVVTRTIYNATSPGDTATGYHFPEGYLIPAHHVADNRQLAQWVFLGFGLVMGAMIFLGTTGRWKKRNSGYGDSASLGDVMGLIRDRLNGPR